MSYKETSELRIRVCLNQFWWNWFFQINLNWWRS